jgi:hypothetical protein
VDEKNLFVLGRPTLICNPQKNFDFNNRVSFCDEAAVLVSCLQITVSRPKTGAVYESFENELCFREISECQRKVG